MTPPKQNSPSDISASEIAEELGSLQLEKRPEGVLLPIKAKPGAGRNEIRGVQDGALKAAVTQVPEKGKANKAILELLAKTLKLRKSQISLVSGDTASQKVFLVSEIDVDELRAKIADAL